MCLSLPIMTSHRAVVGALLQFHVEGLNIYNIYACSSPRQFNVGVYIYNHGSQRVKLSITS